ncbi:MerR family transcriptional regulator [Streptomyces albidoflavus]|nr:MerR family transcriptional regulator [Streptomyces albidoflavus]
MSCSVGQVAAFAKVTVRTLHHDDRAGLLSPSERTPAGYRLYGDADLARLQQILFYRELGSARRDRRDPQRVAGRRAGASPGRAEAVGRGDRQERLSELAVRALRRAGVRGILQAGAAGLAGRGRRPDHRRSPVARPAPPPAGGGGPPRRCGHGGVRPARRNPVGPRTGDGGPAFLGGPSDRSGRGDRAGPLPLAHRRPARHRPGRGGEPPGTHQGGRGSGPPDGGGGRSGAGRGGGTPGGRRLNPVSRAGTPPPCG